MPGMCCAVACCKNTYLKTRGLEGDNGVSYFRIPKDQTIRKMWMERCKRRDKFNPETSFICSDHFKEEDFERNLRAELMGSKQKKFLKKGAIPSLKLLPGRDDKEEQLSARTERFKRRERHQLVSSLLMKMNPRKKELAMVVVQGHNPTEAIEMMKLDERRRPNFTKEENDNLLLGIRKYSNLLTAKLGPGVTKSMKEKCWIQIRNQVNSAASCGRSVNECKRRWKDIKRKSKKEMMDLFVGDPESSLQNFDFEEMEETSEEISLLGKREGVEIGLQEMECNASANSAFSEKALVSSDSEDLEYIPCKSENTMSTKTTSKTSSCSHNDSVGIILRQGEEQMEVFKQMAETLQYQAQATQNVADVLVEMKEVQSIQVQVLHELLYHLQSSRGAVDEDFASGSQQNDNEEKFSENEVEFFSGLSETGKCHKLKK